MRKYLVISRYAQSGRKYSLDAARRAVASSSICSSRVATRSMPANRATRFPLNKASVWRHRNERITTPSYNVYR